MRSTEEDNVDRWTPDGTSVLVSLPECIADGKVVFEGLKITDTAITSPYTRGFRQQLTLMENLRLYPEDTDK
jgi:hypothetical protein